MSKVIWKYPIPIISRFTLQLPKSYRILSFQVQQDTPTIWVVVDPAQEVETVAFEVYGTGHALHTDLANLDFVGTIQHDSFVWHLFRAKNIN